MNIDHQHWANHYHLYRFLIDPIFWLKNNPKTRTIFKRIFGTDFQVGCRQPPWIHQWKNCCKLYGIADQQIQLIHPVSFGWPIFSPISFSAPTQNTNTEKKKDWNINNKAANKFLESLYGKMCFVFWMWGHVHEIGKHYQAYDVPGFRGEILTRDRSERKTKTENWEKLERETEREREGKTKRKIAKNKM